MFRGAGSRRLGYTPVDRKEKGHNCELHGALPLDQSLTPYSCTLTVSWAMTASLYVRERHVVIPAAERILTSKIVRIETF
jgi:hypothetical protein